MATTLLGGRVAPGVAEAAERAVWLYIRAYGLRVNRWGYSEPLDGVCLLSEIRTLGESVCELVGEDLASAEGPQVLLRLPELDVPFIHEQYSEHVDKTPEGATYRRVVGVSLSRAPYGTVCIAGGVPTGYERGAVFAWSGEEPHQGIPNLWSAPRITVYWRFR